VTINERFAAELVACRDDPGRFNVSILNRGPYWWRQEQISRDICRYATTVVETGNQIGKSYLAAGVILWWLFTRSDPQVVATAPSQVLVGSVLWKELRAAERRSRIPLGLRITESPKASPQLVAGRGAGAMGFATKGVERMSGQHAVNLLHVIDEGSGMEPEIGEALDSHNPLKTVVFGNPLRAEGWFVDLAKQGERERDDPTIPDGIKTVTINVPSTDSPDIGLLRSPRGLADLGFLEKMRRKHGEDSLWWRCHIAAKRPTQSHDVLLPDHWLDACSVAERPDPAEHWMTRRLGCDLGEGTGRDRTVLVVRDHYGVLEWSASAWRGLDAAAAEFVRLVRKWHLQEDRCSYDSLGVGRDLPLFLERHRINAVEYKGNFSGGDDFSNLRTAAAWAFRSRVNPTRPAAEPFHIAPDEHWPQAREEILAHRYDLAGRWTRLESKDDVCARLGRSPDYADALFQTFWSAD
jgi:hypothetical protein